MLRARDPFVASRRRLLVAVAAGLAFDVRARPVPPCAQPCRSDLPAYDVVELGREVEREVSTGALAVDDRGIAVGWVGDRPALFAADGRAERLGDRAGRAIGFDRLGRVIGRHFGSDDGPASAFVRHGAALVETADVPSEAAASTAWARPALPGAFFAEGYGGNRHGDVVGTSDTGTGRPQRAALLRRGRVVDLGSLPQVRAAGWRHLLVAYAINDRGVIVGVGDRDTGAVRGFMLVPRSR
jgi:hypothetical protein